MTAMTVDVARAIIDIGDLIDTMQEGVAALNVVCNAMVNPDPDGKPTLEEAALVYLAGHLGDDLDKVQRLIESLRRPMPTDGGLVPIEGRGDAA
jgi:hypothetical protein